MPRDTKLLLRNWLALIDERDYANTQLPADFTERHRVRAAAVNKTYRRTEDALRAFLTPREPDAVHTLYRDRVSSLVRDSPDEPRFSQAFARAFPEIPPLSPDAAP